ncbi:MAG: hypothetical protein ABIG89_00965 [Candidatus Woesearchaeota archaeon]
MHTKKSDVRLVVVPPAGRTEVPHAVRKDDISLYKSNYITEQERDEIVARVVGRDYVSRETALEGDSLTRLVGSLEKEYSSNLVQSVVNEILAERESKILMGIDAKVEELEGMLKRAYEILKGSEGIELEVEYDTGYSRRYCDGTYNDKIVFLLSVKKSVLELRVSKKYMDYQVYTNIEGRYSSNHKHSKILKILVSESNKKGIEIKAKRTDRLINRRYSLKELLTDYLRMKSKDGETAKALTTAVENIYSAIDYLSTISRKRIDALKFI